MKFIGLPTQSCRQDDGVPIIIMLDSTNPKISVVLPCLNEADTLEVCIKKAQTGIKNSNIAGEVIVADNGSTDESIAIAERLGARVVRVTEKGYGNALMGGIEAARGKYVLMGDADDSYDLQEIPRFVAKLDENYELVMGCRLPGGGGTVEKNAMPLLHRWWGNPMFSFMARLWFNAPFHDVHCGMRAFTKDFYNSLDQRCTGMEFATEMTIKSSLYGHKVTEIPITLYPDGRTSHPPHLKTFRDGWRHLRLYLLYTPRWLFLLPGIFLILLGIISYALALPNLTVGSIRFDVHTLLFGSLFILCGYQAIVFAVFTKTFAVSEGLMPEDPKLNKLFEIVNLEKGLIISLLMLVVGVILLLVAVNQWRLTGFGLLDYSQTMRWVIPGATITALGVQTLFSSFFMSILGMKRK